MSVRTRTSGMRAGERYPIRRSSSPRKFDAPTVRKIRIIKEPDESTDISYLGEFSDTPGEFAINRFPEGRTGGEYRYFNAANVSNMEEADQNYQRALRYERGDVVDYFIQAEAEIAVPQPNGDII